MRCFGGKRAPPTKHRAAPCARSPATTAYAAAGRCATASASDRARPAVRAGARVPAVCGHMQGVHVCVAPAPQHGAQPAKPPRAPAGVSPLPCRAAAPLLLLLTPCSYPRPPPLTAPPPRTLQAGPGATTRTRTSTEAAALPTTADAAVPAPPPPRLGPLCRSAPCVHAPHLFATPSTGPQNAREGRLRPLALAAPLQCGAAPLIVVVGPTLSRKPRPPIRLAGQRAFRAQPGVGAAAPLGAVAPLGHCTSH